MGFPSSFALLLAVLVIVGHLHPFDVAEVRRVDGLGATQRLVDDQVLFLDDFVVHIAKILPMKCCLLLLMLLLRILMSIL